MSKAAKLTIGVKVKNCRESVKMSREDLATKLGLSVGYTAGIERDAAVSLSAETVKKLRKALPHIVMSDEEVAAKNEESRQIAKAYRAKKSKSGAGKVPVEAKKKAPVKLKKKAAPAPAAEAAPEVEAAPAPKKKVDRNAATQALRAAGIEVTPQMLKLMKV